MPIEATGHLCPMPFQKEFYTDLLGRRDGCAGGLRDRPRRHRRPRLRAVGGPGAAAAAARGGADRPPVPVQRGRSRRALLRAAHHPDRGALALALQPDVRHDGPLPAADDGDRGHGGRAARSRAEHARLAPPGVRRLGDAGRLAPLRRARGGAQRVGAAHRPAARRRPRPGADQGRGLPVPEARGRARRPPGPPRRLRRAGRRPRDAVRRDRPRRPAGAEPVPRRWAAGVGDRRRRAACGRGDGLRGAGRAAGLALPGASAYPDVARYLDAEGRRR